MTLKKATKILQNFNDWRVDNTGNVEQIYTPRELTQALNVVIKKLNTLNKK
jgi:hypothetical protein